MFYFTYGYNDILNLLLTEIVAESGCIPQNVKQDQTEDGPTSSSDFLAKQGNC